MAANQLHRRPAQNPLSCGVDISDHTFEVGRINAIAQGVQNGAVLFSLAFGLVPGAPCFAQRRSELAHEHQCGDTTQNNHQKDQSGFNFFESI
jgi:hypothetical protein